MVVTSLCLFARLPFEIWRRLVGLLSYSDVAAISCSTSHEDTKRLLIGYMRRRCCVSTFIRLLVEYGAMPFLREFGKPVMKEDRKHFWRRAIEMIFLYEPELLREGKRYTALIHEDYIHSSGVLFARKTLNFQHRKLQREFRHGLVPCLNHLHQPWFPDYPRELL